MKRERVAETSVCAVRVVETLEGERRETDPTLNQRNNNTMKHDTSLPCRALSDTDTTQHSTTLFYILDIRDVNIIGLLFCFL